MKNVALSISGLGFVAGLVFAGASAAATTAKGPYYATPAWDQQLPASTRFIVLSDWGSAAVLDRETGLVWEKTPNASLVNWYEAHNLCIRTATGGRKGWRLPSIQELASLVDPAASNPALPAGHPFIGVVTDRPGYWSATTAVIESTNVYTAAWGIDFSSGIAGAPSTIGHFYAWCVRGGAGADAQGSSN